MTPLVRVKTSEVARIDSSPPTYTQPVGAASTPLKKNVCMQVCMFLLSVPVISRLLPAWLDMLFKCFSFQCECPII